MEIVWTEYLAQSLLAAFPLFLGFFVAISLHSALGELWYKFWNRRRMRGLFIDMDQSMCDGVLDPDETEEQWRTPIDCRGGSVPDVDDDAFRNIPGESEDDF